MDQKKPSGNKAGLKKSDLIAITGSGGFIGGNLVKYFHVKEFTRIRAADKKPFEEWYLRLPEVENVRLDCSDAEACARVCDGATEVYEWIWR